jgi:carbonic anhydrase/acetyltransferase-like protein (isoleucine patch superfamily)
MIYGLPAAALTSLYRFMDRTWWKVGAITIAPVAYAIVLVTIAGLFSLPHQKYIITGTFRRDLNEPLYFHRRMYGLCWTSVYYFKVVYYICLTIPGLKALTFRLFGYRGGLNFTIYPDTWVRDLPLLRFEEGAYLANRATLGSNIIMTNGTIRVGSISVGKNSCIGHRALVGPGTCIGGDVEVGLGTAVGINAVIADRTRIGPSSAISHGAVIGEECYLGELSYIGACSRLANNIKLAANTEIPARKHVCDQAAANRYANPRARAIPEPIPQA